MGRSHRWKEGKWRIWRGGEKVLPRGGIDLMDGWIWSYGLNFSIHFGWEEFSGHSFWSILERLHIVGIKKMHTTVF
jgi:hypothetical protein